MKKILGLLLLGYAIQGFPSAFCSVLFVELENKTHSTCILIDKNLYNSKLRKEQDLYVIKEGEKKLVSLSIRDSWMGSADLSLTYCCGEGMITIKTTKDACIYNATVFSGTVTPTILSIANMDVNYLITPGMAPAVINTGISVDYPGSITWTFSN